MGVSLRLCHRRMIVSSGNRKKGVLLTWWGRKATAEEPMKLKLSRKKRLWLFNFLAKRRFCLKLPKWIVRDIMHCSNTFPFFKKKFLKWQWGQLHLCPPPLISPSPVLIRDMSEVVWHKAAWGLLAPKHHTHHPTSTDHPTLCTFSTVYQACPNWFGLFIFLPP